LVTARLAEVMTVVVAVPVLLPGLGSGVVLVAVTVLVKIVPAGTLGLTWRISRAVAVAPAGRGPPAGGPLVWTNDTSDVPGGRVSTAFQACASLGPLLVTVTE